MNTRKKSSQQEKRIAKALGGKAGYRLWLYAIPKRRCSSRKTLYRGKNEDGTE